MIDVMMFLLVFFVLLSINVLPALGVKIKPPSSAAPDQLVERERVMLSVDKDGQTYVDGKPVPLAEMPRRITEGRDPAKKLVVAIAIDETADAQKLIDILDVLKLAGISSAHIVARNK